MLRIITTTLVALAVVPAAASAQGVAVQDGGTLRFTGQDDANNGDFAQAYLNTGDNTIRLYNPGVSLQFTNDCSDLGDEISCPVNKITKVDIRGRAGADSLYAFLSVGTVTVDINGGPGDDFLYAGADGNTTAATLRGEGGQDTLYGSASGDTLDGGDDNDFLIGFGGPDTFRGGAGFDTVSYGDRSGPDQHVTVTLDDAQNDGEAGESDNATSDVEDVIGGNGNDTLTGGPGANLLSGGNGNDVLEGAGGSDSFLGGDGNDSVLSRDGRTERIDCGAGTDAAITDTSDTASSCENNNQSDELEADVDKDGANKPADCNDKDPSIRPGATDVPNNGVDEDCAGGDNTRTDADGDGFAPPQDCDDVNPAASPAKQEIYGNKVDEDCNGKQDPLLSFTSRVLNAFKKRAGTVRVNTLSVLNPPRAATVQVICSGGKKRGCFASFTKEVPQGSRLLNLASKKLRRAKLKTGAVIEVRILRKDAIGRVSRFKIVKGKALRKETKLCMAPTDPKPRKC